MPIGYNECLHNECVYQREFLLHDTISIESEAKHGTDARNLMTKGAPTIVSTKNLQNALLPLEHQQLPQGVRLL